MGMCRFGLTEMLDNMVCVLALLLLLLLLLLLPSLQGWPPRVQ